MCLLHEIHRGSWFQVPKCHKGPSSHYPFDPTREWWDVVGNSQGDLVQELGEADLGEEVGEEPVEEFEEEIGEEIGEAVMRRW